MSTPGKRHSHVFADCSNSDLKGPGDVHHQLAQDTPSLQQGEETLPTEASPSCASVLCNIWLCTVVNHAGGSEQSNVRVSEHFGC